MRTAVKSYADRAVGFMQKNADARLAITRVLLDPEVEWSGESPDGGALARLHHLAHQECFIANSVTTEVIVATA